MKFGVIGDIHGFWDERDTAFFNASDYDMLLFVGDFARVVNSLPVARQLAALTKPAWAIPGNHDGVGLWQLLAEVKNRPLAARLGARGMHKRVRRLDEALGGVRLGGYTLAELDRDLGLLVARPHAMGPNRFYYRHYLKSAFGVTDFQASADKLCALVDAAPENLIVLAHNGPAGLGDTPGTPFGCDFDPEHGDFGDPDLRSAIDHAHATGRHVRAVLAGHMHHRSKHTGAWRDTWAQDAATLYLNAARVPRIEDDGARRHHIALTVDGDKVQAETVFVDNAGHEVSRCPLGRA
jgi:uncharacterized protein (TIGR04168 family)